MEQELYNLDDQTHYPYFFTAIDPNGCGKSSDIAIISMVRLNGMYGASGQFSLNDLKRMLQDITGVEVMDNDQISSFGIDSLNAIQLIAKIQLKTDTNLPVDIFVRQNTCVNDIYKLIIK